MGCFLGCFGFKDCSWSKSPLFSSFFLWRKKEPPVPRNLYSSLVSSKEKATPSKKSEEEIFLEKFDGDDCVHDDERKEAKELESITLDMLSPQTEIKMQESPYPTPLKLVDGMQTPGTIYPPKSDYFRTRMLGAQFVYPIPDLSESTFGLTEKIYDSPDLSVVDEDLISFLPKSCDGNEIPNATANYNEEQKVRWQAASFSLSDEKVLPQRKLDGKID